MTIALYQALCCIGIKEQDAEAVVQTFDHTIDQRIQQQLRQASVGMNETHAEEIVKALDQIIDTRIESHMAHDQAVKQSGSIEQKNNSSTSLGVKTLALSFLMALLGLALPLALWNAFTWYFFTRDLVIGMMRCN